MSVCSTSACGLAAVRPSALRAPCMRSSPAACDGPRSAPRGRTATRLGVLTTERAVETDSPARLAEKRPDSGASPSIRSPRAPASTVTSRGRLILESDDELKSNFEHRAWVGSAHVLLGALAYQGLISVQSPEEGLGVFLSAVAAYLLADLGTGIYHWSVDNYGDANTPLVGDQIAAFQGHHQRPWTITEREFCNNVHKVFKPAVPFGALFLMLSPWTPAGLDVGMAFFIWLVCMSQQFHAWSHMKRSELPAPIVTLQEAGLLISRKAHGAHHKAPFEGNYCIVSGLWNDTLDAGGSQDSFFRRLERSVHALTGVEPRCWTEPNYEWVDSYFKDGSNE